MKTQGLSISGGCLVITFGRGVPEPFWARLKHLLTKACLMDEFKADYARERATVKPLEEAGEMRSEWTIANANREERLFRRWVERVCGPQERWPWESGWTDDAVDSYLLAPAAKREAA
jgi:hypothetical protein